MTTIGHVFIPLDREHDGTVPTDDDQAHFESLPVPLALWEPFQQCLSKHLSELTEGQIDREETFWFEATRTDQACGWLSSDCWLGGGSVISVPPWLSLDDTKVDAR
jgi:hypothetical protein